MFMGSYISITDGAFLLTCINAQWENKIISFLDAYVESTEGLRCGTALVGLRGRHVW